MIRKLTLALMMSGSVLAAQTPAFAQSAAPVSARSILETSQLK